MTNDQINDLCGVLEAGFKMIASELTVLRAEVSGTTTAVKEIVDELENVKVQLRDLNNHGIDVYKQ